LLKLTQFSSRFLTARTTLKKKVFNLQATGHLNYAEMYMLQAHLSTCILHNINIYKQVHISI